MRFHNALSATGRNPGRRVLSVDRAAASAAEAEALRLAAFAPVLRVEGLTLSGGMVIGHFRSAFPGERLAAMETPLRDGRGVTESLALCGVTDHLRAWTRLTALAADPLMAGHLNVRPGAPVMRAESVNVDPEGLPVEYGIAHFAGERVTLTVVPD